MKTNVIYCGDCKEILTSEIEPESINLIYLDPPFFSNKHYEVIWGNGAELRSFEDRWRGGIEHYISWMEPRLYGCQRVLKETGSIYLHCDSHADAHLRILMDKIFGESNFQNEIVWYYGGPSAIRKGFPRKHDIILFYSKSSNFKFNPQFDSIEKSYVMGRIRQDLDGRKWVDQNLGKLTKETIEKMEAEGRIFKTSTGKFRRKQYIDEMKGEQLTDVWDIDIINSQSKERLGYPTQKPVALLERIVKASSNKDDIVLDPFCGCGTTLAVAKKLERKWIGIDVSPVACKVMKGRMESLGGIVDVEIIGLPVTIDELKKYDPFKFQEYMCRKLKGKASERKSGDMGIDGYVLENMAPIQVKQSESIGRNVVDNFETAIKRKKKKEGIIVAFSFTKSAYEEAARAKREEGLEITLKEAADLL